MMRVLATVCLVGLITLASGCGSRPENGSSREPAADLSVKSKALVTGKLERGTFWKNALAGAGANEGHEYASGSRVEVYDRFVVVTTPDGLSHVHPHGHYSGLAVKRD